MTSGERSKASLNQRTRHRRGEICVEPAQRAAPATTCTSGRALTREPISTQRAFARSSRRSGVDGRIGDLDKTVHRDRQVRSPRRAATRSFPRRPASSADENERLRRLGRDTRRRRGRARRRWCGAARRTNPVATRAPYDRADAAYSLSPRRRLLRRTEIAVDVASATPRRRSLRSGFRRRKATPCDRAGERPARSFPSRGRDGARHRGTISRRPGGSPKPAH